MILKSLFPLFWKCFSEVLGILLKATRPSPAVKLQFSWKLIVHDADEIGSWDLWSLLFTFYMFVTIFFFCYCPIKSLCLFQKIGQILHFSLSTLFCYLLPSVSHSDLSNSFCPLMCSQRISASPLSLINKRLWQYLCKDHRVLIWIGWVHPPSLIPFPTVPWVKNRNGSHDGPV